MKFFDFLFPKEADSPKDYPFSEEFGSKLLNLAKYYLAAPSINKDGSLEDVNQYLTTEDIGILVDVIVKKARLKKAIASISGKPSANPFDTENVQFIEDHAHFDNLKKYLFEHPLQKIGDNIKLLLKIKKFEPTHYGASYGVHTVPVYLRVCKDLITDQQEVRVFIHDAASGLLCDVRDGFQNLTTTLHMVLTQQGLAHKIIKTSGVVQGDFFTCPIHSIQALKYFISNGHNLFTEIMPHLVPQEKKVYDLDKPYIYHLRIDALPAQFLALTNRSTVQRVRTAYHHPWMSSAGKIDIKRAYYARRNLLSGSLHKPINTKRTLNQVLTENSIPKTSSQGILYQHNALPWKKFLSYRKKIAHTIAIVSGINLDANNIPRNYPALQDHVKRVILR